MGGQDLAAWAAVPCTRMMAEVKVEIQGCAAKQEVREITENKLWEQNRDHKIQGLKVLAYLVEQEGGILEFWR